MFIRKNIIITGSAQKPMATDIFSVNDPELKPLVIYAHGFNGFKDWADFDIIARQFAEAGFVFVKFNFSHNGTTPDHPEEFTDLQAYAENNYTKELDDLQAVIDWCLTPGNEFTKNADKESLYLVGHSRGGGIVLLKAAEDTRVKKVATWASVSECKTPWGNWPVEKLEEWKNTNVQFVANSRTKQQMPLHYQLYENYIENRQRLDIQSAIRSLNIPVLICHGTKDEAVPYEKALQLKEWQPAAELFSIESDHVFERRHPWLSRDLPQAMQNVVNKTISFLKKDKHSI